MDSYHQDYFVINDDAKLRVTSEHYASDVNYIERNNVDVVVSLIRGQLVYNLPAHVEHHQIPIDDDDEANLLIYLDHFYELILVRLKRKMNVVVHCVNCVSRAPTFTVAFLMRYLKETRNLDFEQSKHFKNNPFLLVESQANWQAEIRESFRIQLYLYWHKLYDRKHSLVLLRMWLESKLDDFYHQRNDDQEYFTLCSRMISDCIEVIYGDHKSVVRCGRCRKEIFDATEIYYISNNKCFGISTQARFFQESGHFLKCTLGSGNINCPNCQTKLGHYNWDSRIVNHHKLKSSSESISIVIKFTLMVQQKRLDYHPQLLKLIDLEF